MNITGFDKVAPYLTNPLVLAGFVLMLAYGIHWQLMKSGLLAQATKKDSALIIRLFLRYGFWLALVLLLAGFGLVAWNSYIDAEAKQLQKEVEQLRAINQRQVAEQYFLQEQLKAKDQQIETKDQQLNSLTEAVATVIKTDASAKMKQQALEAMRRGNGEQAKALLVDFSKRKEEEGKQAYKEAAEAARSLGALAYMNDTKAALTAYQKAVELDPDNADGWNHLGLLLTRTGALNQAEQMYKKALEINKHSGCKEGTACANINLGTVYLIRGELDKAEQLYKAVLATSQSLGDKKAMMRACINLGTMYAKRGNLDQAEQWYRKGLEMSQALGDKRNTAKTYVNLGIVCNMRGDLNQAEQLYIKALEMSRLLGDKKILSNIYGSLGNLYAASGELDQAEQMYRKALEINEALGSKEGMAKQYGNMGFLYEKRGELDRAEEMHKKSLVLFQEISSPDAKKVQQWLDKLAQQRTTSTQ
ncbi:MAG: tetratricopeptide repeat protein [Candidatus Electrothrix sp. Rat3]|nr:tetratricopeptide repeat protein [Candidatus Electrothrix rattekaaiensis]